MSSLEGKKEEILNTLLRTVAWLGLIAYVPSFYASIVSGFPSLIIVNSLGYGAVLAVMLYPGSTYRAKLSVIVVATLSIGIAVLLLTGSEGAGHIWLLFAVIISSLFGKKRIAVFSITFSAAALALVYFVGKWGLVEHRMAGISALAIGSNLTLVAIAVFMIINQLFGFLRGELEEKEYLLRLLHHRVKNNLQMVQSLISLNGYSGMLERQVSAIAAANEAVLRDPQHEATDVRELLAALIRPGVDRIEGGAVIPLSPERTTELAVGFVELAEKAGARGALRVQIQDEARDGGTRECIITITLEEKSGACPPEELKAMAAGSLLPSGSVTLLPGGRGLSVAVQSRGPTG